MKLRNIRQGELIFFPDRDEVVRVMGEEGANSPYIITKTYPLVVQVFQDFIPYTPHMIERLSILLPSSLFEDFSDNYTSSGLK